MEQSEEEGGLSVHQVEVGEGNGERHMSESLDEEVQDEDSEDNSRLYRVLNDEVKREKGFDTGELSMPLLRPHIDRHFDV